MGFLGVGVARGVCGLAGVEVLVVVVVFGGGVMFGGCVGVVSSKRWFFCRFFAVRGVGLVWKCRVFF